MNKILGILSIIIISGTIISNAITPKQTQI